MENTSMSEGSIAKKIIYFAIPLFLGNLFQQLYNTADSLIVGNFLGSSALAAVASSGNLIFLLVGFFNGIFVGAGVVIARYFGAKDELRVHRSIHTTVALGIISGLLLSVVGVIFAPKILVLMGTPKDVLPNSIIYFRIYFMRSLAFVLYNALTGILQAVGDSRHPLYYLIVSSIINIILDIVFITVFHMGVGSAALATIISQFVSALLCLYHLLHAPEVYRLHVKDIRFDLPMFKQIINNGLPAGIQNSIIALANVVVQSHINSFGKMAVAGCGAYSKIEGFGFLPITCFALALTTFVSQNLGAQKYERVKKGAHFGIVCSLILAEVVGISIYILAPFLISMFDQTKEVVAFGTAQARSVTLFYFLLAFSHCIAGILRGAGKSVVPMIVMMVCWCIIRVTYITVAVMIIPQIQMVFWAYPLTWTLSSIVFFIYYRRSHWLSSYKTSSI
ncbi:MATE family efflux transporter [Longibaculum muris]|uniref:Probable multidrug resistance protein NorM n=1 Tax=Longibaculum muris TaxID=1796628 RepID=A0A4R3Z5Y1_9FIRM|nr:MATE family efflux transporter [Longibaculum muris]MCR1887279.1 MATE family efflux transporter [Longibaculum muris]TCW02147.1 putative MATE family efflux protein [Longibaculum muris]